MRPRDAARIANEMEEPNIMPGTRGEQCGTADMLGTVDQGFDADAPRKSRRIV